MSLFIQLVIYLKYLPSIVFKIRNWPEFVLNYIGIRDKSCTYVFRNGLKIKTGDGISSGTIAVIFIKKDYGNVDDNSVIVDIGANIGVYSIFAAQSKNTVVYAYEPMPDNYNLLRENIESNKLGGHILPFNLAVGAKEEKKKLYIGLSPYNSFYPISKSPFNTLYGDGFQEKNQKYIEINSVPLKEVFDRNKINRCDILKMDCEGAEFEILYNLPEEYFRRINKIRLEYHNHLSDEKNNADYLMKFLEKKGYRIEKNIKRSDYNGDIWLENSHGL